MKTITSRENPLFKTLRKLAGSARERRKAGRTLLDGIHLVRAYLEAGGIPDAVAVSPSACGRAEVQELLRRLPEPGVVQMPDHMLHDLSTVESATGLVALIAIPQAAAAAPGPFCVLLEDLQDPGNLGSILRSAAAAGAQSAYLSPRCADSWSPKVLRAGMGAHFLLHIHENADLVETARTFPGRVIAASLAAQRPLYQLDLSGEVAFVIGNEGVGISAPLQQAATDLVRIPMPGAVESLNAAAAAAVCFFEKVRQQQRT